MPTKNKKSKSKEKIKLDINSTKERIRLIKQELHYFKGLSVVLTVMIVCVFLAFAALFSAMYVETKMTRLYYGEIYKEILAQNGLEVPVDVSGEPEYEKNQNDRVESKAIENLSEIIKENQWLSFSKYGLTVYFPPKWAYVDNPYREEGEVINFYSGGEVPEQNEFSADMEVYVNETVDRYADEQESQEMKVAGLDADWYVMDNGTAAMVIEKTEGGYVELFFRYQDTEGEQMIDEQTVFNILDKLKIEK